MRTIVNNSLGALLLGMGLLTFVMIFFICPIITYFAFNYLAPIFNFRQISFWESIVLYALCRTLFGANVTYNKQK